jgi:C-terminal processing protease CtpA/Prc/tricorn protease-like protein
MRLLFITLLTVRWLTINGQEDVQVFRYPSLSSDGSQIAFTYQGDIWTVEAQGGDARRLTIHEAYDYAAQWSGDDDRLLFSSNRYGNDDLYTIGVNGQNLQRLTYNSAGDYNASYKDDNTIHFSTRRNWAMVEREAEYYEISASGGTPYRSMESLGLESSYNNTATLLALVRGTCRTSREKYRGPANRNIWVYNPTSDTYTQLTTDEGQDTQPQWGSGNELYYLSASEGRYNIYRQTIDANGAASGAPVKLTNQTKEGIDWFEVSRDGSTLVYTLGGSIYTKSTDTGATAQRVIINVTEDYRFDPDEYMTNTNGSNEIALSPNEKLIAYTVRGDVFIKKNDEDKPRSVAPSPHTARESDVAWINDSTILFLSDRDGDYDLYAAQAKEGGDIFESFEWTTTQIQNTPVEESYFVISPDHSKVAISSVTGELFLVDVDSMGVFGTPRQMLSGWNTANALSFSPNSEWIAYSRADLDFNNEIYIQKADPNATPINVSMHPRNDLSPVWSADGSKLGFTSVRNNGDSDVWFAWLKEEDWQRTSSDWDDYEADDDADVDSTFYIDVEGIHERLTQVTRLPGNEYNLMISKDGEHFYFSTNGGGRQGFPGSSMFKKVKWNGEDEKTILKDGRVGNLTLDSKGKNIYYTSRGQHKSIDAEGKKSKSLPFRAKMKVDARAERAQIFDEAWRTMRDRFYDPKFHGEDWDELREIYEPRALAASTKQDFSYMVNLMLGQLNSSHMGLRGGVDEETQRLSTGRLGLELMPEGSNVKVTRVVPDSPADRESSKLNEGDVITAVNGQSIGGQNFYAMVNQTVDERIQLTVRRNGVDEHVVIRPSRSTRDLLYEEWVDDRKALVDKYSNGRLGYIHIRGMNWTSFERFERELMASGYGKDGIVIDVRYNGGGWTTDMVMAVLNVRQHSYTVPRGATDDLQRDNDKYKNHYPYGERLPLSSLTKPSIALCNENSYSNAEIFSHAYKHLDHGSLVGAPTFGAVISTGGRGLMDGFFIRVPFRAWYVKATGENMEHGPAVPDYIIYNQPDSRAKGNDEQLKKSVDVLLSEINGQ